MVLGLEQSCFTRDVSERAISIVPIQHVLTVVGYKQIHETIVVVITDAYPLSPTRAHEIGFCSHIRECAVTIVLVEVICWLLAFWETIKSPAVDDEYIQPAIIVVVE